MRASRFITVLAATFAAISIHSIAFADDYIGSGKFPTNNLNWAYAAGSIYSDGGGDYVAPTQNAMADWSALTDLNLFYDNNWDAIYEIFNYGNTGWTGSVYICVVGGSCYDGAPINQTYSWCQARLNQYYLVNHSQSRRENSALHEMGHCWSLGHRSDSSSVMQASQTTITIPNSLDRSLVNVRY
jgi:hypothetical protein